MAHKNNDSIASKLGKLGKRLTFCGTQVYFEVAGRMFGYDTTQHVFTERTDYACKTVSYADVLGAFESVLTTA